MIIDQSYELICRSAHQSKALELPHLTVSSLWQSAHRGCAEIGRQLLPLKARDLTNDVGHSINQSIHWQWAYQSQAHDLAMLIIPLLCLSVHRGCAGIGRQLHPLKAKIKMDKWFHRIVCMRHPIAIGGPVLVYFHPCPSVHLSVRPSTRMSVHPYVSLSACLRLP